MPGVPHRRNLKAGVPPGRNLYLIFTSINVSSACAHMFSSTSLCPVSVHVPHVVSISVPGTTPLAVPVPQTVSLYCPDHRVHFSRYVLQCTCTVQLPSHILAVLSDGASAPPIGITLYASCPVSTTVLLSTPSHITPPSHPTVRPLIGGPAPLLSLTYFSDPHSTRHLKH
jgi:hypothetical protein